MMSPLGDHRGWVSKPVVSRRGFAPSASITQMLGAPLLSELKVISRPVGDQEGSVSMARLLVRRRNSEVPTRRV